jgi:signal transduction histidine kinase
VTSRFHYSGKLNRCLGQCPLSSGCERDERAKKEKAYPVHRQALLILLPLIGLAGFGVFSLQQDRRLARVTAVEQAQSIADFLLPRLRATVQENAQSSATRFSVDGSGNAVFPKSAPRLEDLPQTQERSGSSELAESRFHDAVVLLRNGQVRDAATILSEISIHHPDARGETGLPIAPLAEFKLLQIQTEMSVRLSEIVIRFDAFCSNLVSQPSMWTPLLLGKAEGLALSSEDKEVLRHWQTVWLQHEEARDGFRIVQHRFGDPWNAPALAVLDPDLLLMEIEREPQDTNRWFAVAAFSQVATRLEAVLKQTAGVPSYLSLNVHIAGAPIASPDSTSKVKPGPTEATQRREILASAAEKSGDLELLKVDVVLADPALLYRQQRARTRWFATFVGLASVVALTGLFGAWRSFRQQERLNEMKSNFVSSVSHELRAPIASVRLMAENLELGKVQEEPRRMEYFRFISQECRRLSSLVENVLDFSRIEQGRKQYEFETVDLNGIIDSTVKLMQPPASERGVTLCVATRGGTMTPVSADGKALQQALVNLVDNAIKHSQRGSEVIVGTGVASDGRGFCSGWKIRAKAFRMRSMKGFSSAFTG